MTKEEALAGLELMELQEKRREQMGSRFMVLNSLHYMALMGSADMMPKPHYGKHRGEYSIPKNTDNRPERAKGMKPFDVDGVTIYAGTIKAARKKAKLLSKRA